MRRTHQKIGGEGYFTSIQNVDIFGRRYVAEEKRTIYMGMWCNESLYKLWKNIYIFFCFVVVSMGTILISPRSSTECQQFNARFSCKLLFWLGGYDPKLFCSNLLTAAVVSLGKALCLHCLVPQKRLKAIGSLVACLWACCFLKAWHLWWS